MVEWLSPLIFSALNHTSSDCCGFEPSSGHVRRAKFCLRVVRCFFSGISRFRPALRLTRLKTSEIILTGRKTQIKKKKKGHLKSLQLPFIVLILLMFRLILSVVTNMGTDRYQIIILKYMVPLVAIGSMIYFSSSEVLG